ncbi:mannose-1-phosphate guanylyltransferase/mannose-6-phosphate isomerase [Acetobacter orientalis]|uniref:mannose-1-phosphate guanylyltransferase/mannose-6-phosphate isomerase n=1 Tax=Acetobacter orientalis TaxID=146474 RepID=UPI00386378CC
MSTAPQVFLQSQKPVIPVILSGGTGSRLWPVSRSSYPKQFWPLLTQHTLLQETALRAQKAQCAAPIVICNAEHRFIIAEQLREIGISDARIVLEPVGRNSAPAIAAAAFLVAETTPDAVLWVMAADAAITDDKPLQDALAKAEAAAQAGRIVTFGIKPRRPETGYGYIECGQPLGDIPGVFDVSRFIEKPQEQDVRALVADSRYLWNSGMFVAQAKTFLTETEQYAPEVYQCVKQAVQARKRDIDFERLDVDTFSRSPDISVDYALIEHTDRIAVVPGDFGWSDIGSWDALWEISPKDDDNNVAVGDVLLDKSRNCYVRSDGALTTVVGVEDLVVVVTRDAVMIVHRDRTQDVKKIVSRLNEAGRPEAVSHNRSYRPWGFYEGLIQGDRFQVKRIVVEPGHKLSLQKHFHRAEHWIVVGGTALVTRDDEQMMVRENESVYLPLGSVHRLENPGRIPLTLIEVQSGPYLGEDDIVRMEDVYSRT